MIACSIALIFWVVGLSWMDHKNRKTLVVEVHHAESKLEEG